MGRFSGFANAVMAGAFLVGLGVLAVVGLTSYRPLADLRNWLDVSRAELAVLLVGVCGLIPVGLLIVAAAIWAAVRRAVDGEGTPGT